MTDGIHVEMAQRAVELLKDGQWHPYEVIARDLMKLVPAGRALRSLDQHRGHAMGITAGNPVPPRIRDPGIDALIAKGQHSTVVSFLNNKSFEVNPKGMSGNGFAAREHNAKRKVRMVKEPRYAGGDPGRLERDHLRATIERLEDRLAWVERTLVDLGKEPVDVKRADFSTGVVYAVEAIKKAMET